MEHLPSDIVFNILARLPLKSLLCLRCVSKILCDIIDSPVLDVVLFNRAQAVPENPQLILLSYPSYVLYPRNAYRDTIKLYLVQRDPLEHEGNILRTPPRIEYPTAEFANCQESGKIDNIGLGMFLLRNCFFNRSWQSFLFNPHRAQLMMLPQGWISPCGPHYWCCGFGFDSTTITYKLVRVFFRKSDSNTCKCDVQCSGATEVYRLGTRSWRRVSSVPPCRMRGQAVYAYGDAHWMINSTYLPIGSTIGMIVSFDMKKEEFKLTPHPDFPGKIGHFFHLIDLKGSLAIMDFNSIQMDTWVLKDYHKNEWVREYRISVESWPEEMRTILLHDEHIQLMAAWDEHIQLMAAWEDGVVFKICSFDGLYYANLKTGCLSYMSYRFPIPKNSSIMFTTCTGSLVSLRKYGNLMEKEPGPRNCFALERAGQY